MTQAVCLRCGEMKVGAFTPCPACGFDPSGDRNEASKALLLTDHYSTKEELNEASERIKGGESPELDEQKAAELARGLPESGIGEMPIGCQVAAWAPIVVMVVLAFFVAYLFLVVLR